jgi:cell division septal protein FtsQ
MSARNVSKRVKRNDKSSFIKRIIRGVFLLLLLALPAAAAMGWLKYSDSIDAFAGRILTVDSWSVEGVLMCDKLSLRSRLDGIVGDDLRKIDISSLEKSLRSDTWIRDVKIIKEWPNAIRICISEFHPVAYFIENKNCNCLTESGTIVSGDFVEGIVDLPVFSCRFPDPVEKKSELKILGKVFNDLRVNYPVLYQEIDWISWQEFPEIHLRSMQGLSVITSQSSWQHCISMLQAIRKYKPELMHSFGTIDLRFTNQIVWRTKDA